MFEFNSPESSSTAKSSLILQSQFLICILLVCVFLVIGGSGAPSVNESHYLTKARHFWDSEYLAEDLFVASKDAHWFFFLAFGWITNLFSWSIAAYLGRLICWTLIAISWAFLARALHLRGAIVVISAILFVGANEVSHLSGEWIIGGFESKCIAYALLFMALSQMLSRHWNLVWIFLGGASAFHVVIGAWASISMMMTCIAGLLFGWTSWRAVRRSLPGLTGGGALSLLGVVPALAMNWGIDPTKMIQANRIYVFDRLSHHLVPTSFAAERWQSFFILFLMTTGAIAFYQYNATRSSGKPKATSDSARYDTSNGLRWLWCFAASCIGLACLGFLIDRLLSATHPDRAAALLRLYWFRLNDITLPLVFSLTLGAWLKLECSFRQTKWVLGSAILIASGAFLGTKFINQMNQSFPDADRLTLLLPQETDAQRTQTYRDWKNVCNWIREHTDRDSVFLTPVRQQTFKWYSDRMEWVCWKDVPQDAQSLIEWRSRMDRLRSLSSQLDDPMEYLRGLIALRNDYNIRYAVIDRRLQRSPPLLPIVYPQADEINATFCVFELMDYSDPHKSVP